ncbi:hypothetical protein BD311DRAFT_782671 [Dichomitus squalens]|uniref:Uncharacterized protein n=1 Tax=Dichomitus squalens TaxID=114155 RepID=A0A4Q9M4N6_9APHY|nr:hypothetical protein BD311DRAFT_782671 [Dichomitus squalens]
MGEDTDRTGIEPSTSPHTCIPALIPPGIYPSQVDIRTFYSYTRNKGVYKYDTKPNASLRKKRVAELDMIPHGVQVRPSPSCPLSVPSADQPFDVLHPPSLNATSDVNGSTIEIALSSMRLSTVRDVRTGSIASSINPSSGVGIPQAAQRLSVDLAHLIMNAQGRHLCRLDGVMRQERRTWCQHDREKECEEKEEGKKTSRESRQSTGSLADHPMVCIEEATADERSPLTDNKKVDNC